MRLLDCCRMYMYTTLVRQIRRYSRLKVQFHVTERYLQRCCFATVVSKAQFQRLETMLLISRPFDVIGDVAHVVTGFTFYRSVHGFPSSDTSIFLFCIGLAGRPYSSVSNTMYTVLYSDYCKKNLTVGRLCHVRHLLHCHRHLQRRLQLSHFHHRHLQHQCCFWSVKSLFLVLYLYTVLEI